MGLEKERYSYLYQRDISAIEDIRNTTQYIANTRFPPTPSFNHFAPPTNLIPGLRLPQLLVHVLIVARVETEKTLEKLQVGKDIRAEVVEERPEFNGFI
jgi:hypothetical protein